MLQLGEILQRMKVLLQQLTEILNIEHQLLIENGSAHQLSSVIDQKSQLLVNLKLLDDERISLTQKYDLEPPYLNESSLMSQWSAIEKETEHLANANRENGIIMQMRMDSTLKKINFLSQANNTNVYNYDGCIHKDLVSKKRAEV